MKSKRNYILFSLAILLIFTTVRCLPINGVIKGYVWDDKDKNGIIDDGEDMVGGVTVQLLDGTGEILKAETTDYSGYYIFRELKTGANRIYEIKVFAPPQQTFTKQGSRDNAKASHVDQSGFSGEVIVNDVHDINAGLVELTPESDVAPPVSAPPEPTEDASAGTTGDDQCGTNDNPVTRVDEYTTATDLTYQVHATTRGKWWHAFLYLPWVRGDGRDWGKTLDQYFDDLPVNVYSVTYPGCEGGCQEWTPEKWKAAVEDIVANFGNQPCMQPNPRVIIIGVSIGGDLGLLVCPEWMYCSQVIAFSANGFIEPTLEEEITLMKEYEKPMTLVYGELDPEMTALNAIANQLSWVAVNGFERGTQNGLDVLKLLTSSAHGNDLYKENLILFLKTEVIDLESE